MKAFFLKNATASGFVHSALLHERGRESDRSYAQASFTPKPVLVKCSFLYINGSKRLFSSCTNPREEEINGREMHWRRFVVSLTCHQLGRACLAEQRRQRLHHNTPKPLPPLLRMDHDVHKISLQPPATCEKRLVCSQL
jgi:hypothetical protein